MSTKSRAVLEVQQGGQVNIYTIPEAALTIGRSSDSDIVIDDTLASRRHAEVKWRNDTLFIKDLNSSNGTLVNGRRIDPQTEIALNNSDVIVIGDSRLIIRIEPAFVQTPISPVSEEPVKTSRFVPPAQVAKTKFPKGIVIGAAAGVLVIAAIVAVVVALSISNQNEIRAAAADSLIALTDTGIETTDAKIISIDQRLESNITKLMKLEPLIAAADEWIEYQKTISRTGSWLIEVDKEGLEQLMNDQYKISTLQILSDRGVVSSTVKVTDLVTKSIHDPAILQKDLVSEQETLLQQRDSLIQEREQTVEAINGCLALYADWDVKKIQKATYNIKGDGLGWGNGVTSGVWIYYEDRENMEPRNKPAQDLEALLTAK